MVADDQGHSGLVAVAFEDGQVSLLQNHYSTDFSAGIELRKIIPKLDFPYGTDLRDLMPGGGITGLALSDNESELLLAAAGSGGRVRLERNTSRKTFSAAKLAWKALSRRSMWILKLLQSPSATITAGCTWVMKVAGSISSIPPPCRKSGCPGIRTGHHQHEHAAGWDFGVGG